MKSSPYLLCKNFWAKLDTAKDTDDSCLVNWHPLAAHSADVAAVVEALLFETVLNQKMARIVGSKSLSEKHIKRLSFMSALHDTGKFNHGFQQRAFNNKGRITGHVKPLIGFLDSQDPMKNEIIKALDLQSIIGWFGSEENLIHFLLAVFAHHGTPQEPSAIDFNPALWRPADNKDPLNGIKQLVHSARQWFPEAFSRQEPPLPADTKFQHAFNGLLILADWIASDEQFFPFAEPETDRIMEARRFADEALNKLGLNPKASRETLLRPDIDFHTIAPEVLKPRPIQQDIAMLPLHKNGSLTIMESDTGSGKTEAALVRFTQLYRNGHVDGMYFALPTRTAATQIHSRVTEAARRAFPNPECRPPVILAVPGYLSVDDKTGRPLPGFDVLWDDNDKERWHWRGWAAENAKRYLAGTIVVGTIDQVLLSTLQVKHAHLRSTALLRHFLVVDEVHASDAYIIRLLDEVLKNHLDAGGHALLMSATLGSSARERFLQPQLNKKTPSQTAAKVHYPLLSHADGIRNDIKEIKSQPTEFHKEVNVTTSPIADVPEAIAEKALAAASHGAKVLIIRNTVKDCLAVQQELEKLSQGRQSLLMHAAFRPAPHHSRYVKEDRKMLDETIEKHFGKNAPAAGIVVAATQTVQQSLDLDADIMISDLCPIDVLLQRAGRLHRHSGRSRPEGYEKALLEIVVPSERDMTDFFDSSGKAWGPHGLGTVYEDIRMLEAAWRLIEKYTTWTIPDMNRQLVEGGLHSDILSGVAEEMGEKWKKHQQFIDGSAVAHRLSAKNMLVRRDRPFGHPDTLFPSERSEAEQKVKTRLGEDDRIIELPHSVKSPFGRSFCKINIPSFYLPDAEGDCAVEDIKIEESGLTFTVGGVTFIYNRLGLQKL